MTLEILAEQTKIKSQHSKVVVISLHFTVTTMHISCKKKDRQCYYSLTVSNTD